MNDVMLTATDMPTVVKTESVSKRFIIHKDKSLKERVLHPRRSRKHRDDFWALQNVSIEIGAGETIGLIGPNGSGKSTLLKVIGGIIEPTSGDVYTRGRMAALLELGAGFHPDLTGRENVYLNASILGMTREETDALFDDIVEFSGIPEFIDTQVKFYSSGMYVRLAFAVAINVNPDILLVDEVLAVGDENFQNKCLDKIRQFQEEGRTIILVSHSLGQIVEFCTRAIVLGNGSVVYDGDAADAVSILRAGYKTRAEADAAKGQLERERARELETQRIREMASITDVTTRIVSPSDEGKLLPGGDLEIEVEAEFANPQPGWTLGISLTNKLGTSVTSTSSAVTGLRETDAAERVRVRFALPSLTLGTGEYAVTAAIFDGEHREIDRVDGQAPFSAHAWTNSTGTLYVNAKAQLVS